MHLIREPDGPALLRTDPAIRRGLDFAVGENNPAIPERTGRDVELLSEAPRSSFSDQPFRPQNHVIISNRLRNSKSIFIPSRINFQFKSTPGEFGALLGCLRAARKGGIQVDLTAPDLSNCKGVNFYWRGFIEHKTLEVNMYRQEDEVENVSVCESMR